MLSRLKDIIQGVMEFLNCKANDGLQGRVQPVARGDVGTAVFGWCCDGRIFLPQNCVIRRWIKSLGLVSGRTMGHAQHASMAGHERAQTNCFVDDPIIVLRGTAEQRRKLAMEVLLWWSSLGLKLTRKGLDLMDRPALLGMTRCAELQAALPQLKPFVRQLWASLFKHSTGDKVKFVCKRQVWPALSWLRMFHGHQRGDLVRHMFLVDQTLDGLVLEVDASTTGGGAACWLGDRRNHNETHLMRSSFPCGPKKTNSC